MPDLPFKPDARDELLLAMVIDRLDALLDLLKPPAPEPTPEPAPARKRTTPKRTAEEA
jgi:hypothetical protein